MYSNYNKPPAYNVMPGMVPTATSYGAPSQYGNQPMSGGAGIYGAAPMMSGGMMPKANLSMPPPSGYPMPQSYQAQQVQQSPWASGDKSAMSTEPEPDPDMYETCVYLGIDDGDGFDFRTRVIGEKGENLDYMRRSTGAKVLLRGKGSGVYNNRPPHIFISHATLQGMTDAEKLATNLVNVIKEDYQEYKAKRGSSNSDSMGMQSSRDQSRSNSSIVVDYGHNRNTSSAPSRSRGNTHGQDRERDMLGQDSRGSRFEYEDGSSGISRGGHAENGRSSQMAQREGRQSMGYLEDSQTRQPNRYSGGRSDNRNEQYAGNQQQSADFYCELCNVHCPNKQMFTLHCKGVMHTDKLDQQRRRPPLGRESSRSIADDMGGTHWEGPPDMVEPEGGWQGSSGSNEYIEDYVFNQCERLLKTMIANTTLRNLKRSVEKIGQRDLKSAIPNKPQSSYYCKLCKEDVLNMQLHLAAKSHGNLYLLRQIQLGDLFMDYYSDVPIPGVITNGGRVLAMDTLTFGPCIPETNRERFKELLVYTGAYLAYKCSVCVTNIATLGNWVQHITSKKHGKRCIEVMLENGIKYFMAKNPHIPIPPPRNALEILSGMDITYIHPTMPQARRSSSGVQSATSSIGVQSASSSRGQMNKSYQLLSALPTQDRQLVLQVQALTGIDDLTLIINVLTALGNMDPAMLQTLSALDPMAIQHAMAGNMAFQGMEVPFVQQVIKMYLNYKGVSTVNIPQQQMRYQQQMQQRAANQIGGNRSDSRNRGDQRGGRVADRRPGSRWDDGSRDDRRDRSIDQSRGRNDNRGRDSSRIRNDSRQKMDRGRTDPKRDNRDKRVESKEKAGVKNKKPESKDVKTDNKGKKTDDKGQKTDGKAQKTDTKDQKTDGKAKKTNKKTPPKPATKPTSVKRPGDKAGPKAKKPKVNVVDLTEEVPVVDLTEEPSTENEKKDKSEDKEKDKPGDKENVTSEGKEEKNKNVETADVAPTKEDDKLEAATVKPKTAKEKVVTEVKSKKAVPADKKTGESKSETEKASKDKKAESTPETVKIHKEEKAADATPEVTPRDGAEVSEEEMLPALTKSPARSKAKRGRGRGRGRGAVRKVPARKTRGSVVAEADNDLDMDEDMDAEPEAKKVKEKADESGGGDFEMKAVSDTEDADGDLDEIDEDALLAGDDDDIAGLETVDEV